MRYNSFLLFPNTKIKLTAMKKKTASAKAAKSAKPVKSARPAKAVKAAQPDELAGLPYVWHPKPHPLRKRIPKNNLGHVARHLRALGPNFHVPGRPLPKPRRPDSTYP